MNYGPSKKSYRTKYVSETNTVATLKTAQHSALLAILSAWLILFIIIGQNSHSSLKSEPRNSKPQLLRQLAKVCGYLSARVLHLFYLTLVAIAKAIRNRLSNLLRYNPQP